MARQGCYTNPRGGKVCQDLATSDSQEHSLIEWGQSLPINWTFVLMIALCMALLLWWGYHFIRVRVGWDVTEEEEDGYNPWPWRRRSGR